MRRILNSFLQFMEEASSADSLIIAATNHPDLLNSALCRRFDEVMTYGMPDAAAARKVVERHLGLFRPKQVQWSKVIAACEGLSHGEIARAVDDVIKRAILKKRDKGIIAETPVGAGSSPFSQALSLGKA